MAAKNDDWFVALFVRYGRTLRRYLRRFSLNDGTAADLAQEAFLRMYAASGSETIEHPRAYLFQTARNLALKDIRHRKHAATEPVADFDDLGVYADYPSLEAAQISREEFAMLCRAVEALPAQCRRVFILRKVYSYSYREIAAELGIAVSTAEKHVAKGVTACHRHLREQEQGERQRDDDSKRVVGMGRQDG